uniref:Uncharacterized protein n=1 Tax=Anguilla anguilla TaxID=7936 RepID=A0A0E9U5J1_ANGAN
MIIQLHFLLKSTLLRTGWAY